MADPATPTTRKAIIERAIADLGQLDLLVNMPARPASAFLFGSAIWTAITEELWADLLNVN